jgi:hypothetical protein
VRLHPLIRNMESWGAEGPRSLSPSRPALSDREGLTANFISRSPTFLVSLLSGIEYLRCEILVMYLSMRGTTEKFPVSEDHAVMQEM